MKRPMVGLLVLASLTLVAGCSSGDSGGGSEGSAESTTAPKATTSTTRAAPEPASDQTPPTSINGIAVAGDTIWIASIKDGEILQVDADGTILQRFDTNGAGPDDVAVAPDGSIWSTGFANGDVGHIVDGSYEVATRIRSGINPIAVDGEGVVWIGTYGPAGDLYRLDPKALPADGEAPAPVAAGTMPDINAFGILDDGTIVAPAGGIAGPGSAIAIDPDTGEFTTVVDGLPGVAAGTVDEDGNAYVLANATGEVIAVDVEGGTSEVVRTVEEGVPFDNLSFADDGTLYLSSFTAPTITEVQPDGTERLIAIGS